MKFYRCLNIKCSEQIIYRESEAADWNFRCVQCLQKLEEAPVEYRKFKVGAFFENFIMYWNLLSAFIFSSLVYLVNPPNFGGHVHSLFLQYIFSFLLFIFLQFGGYAKIIQLYKRRVQENEDNLRVFKSWLLSTIGVFIFSLFVIFT